MWFTTTQTEGAEDGVDQTGAQCKAGTTADQPLTNVKLPHTHAHAHAHTHAHTHTHTHTANEFILLFNFSFKLEY